MIPEFNFDENLETLGFPSDLCNDARIAFHGTSSVFEYSIEANGIISRGNNLIKNEIEFVVSVYEQLNWAGLHLRGYAVLKPFSLAYDYSPESGPRIFFGESPLRASLYAEKEYCGGEKYRSLRYS